jgi:hypothetical protein
VPKGIMLVQSGPSDPAREDEYNDWYANTHIPQIRELRARSTSGEIERSDVLQMDPPPVTAVYQLLD